MADDFAQKVRDSEMGGDIWQPEEGDYVVGTYCGDRTITTKVGDSVAIIVEDEITMEKRLIWKSKLIADFFTAKKVRPGERVGLHYHGKPKKSHLWSVFVDREEEPETE